MTTATTARAGPSPVDLVGASAVFYGSDLRASALPQLMEQLRLIAAIPASDADGDRVRGLFLTSHEVEGMAEWQIRGGVLHVTVTDARFKYLDE